MTSERGWDAGKSLTVLDERSWPEIAVRRLWRAADRDPLWARLGAGLSRAASRRCIDRRCVRRGTAPVRPLIVSIGNLALGGTGKTPIVAAVASELASRGVRGAIVTRGYPSRLRGPLRVKREMSTCGDEARLLSELVPNWPVVQAADRAAGLRWTVATWPDVALVLLEDGHQTAGTPRHLDLLILDRWAIVDGRLKPRAGHVVPWGPYREDARGAERAAAWLIELPPAGRGPPAAPWSADRPVFQFTRRLFLPMAVLSTSVPYALVSGLARPEQFEIGCATQAGRPPCLVVRCGDHARFGRDQVARWVAAGRRRGVEVWLTTAKDAPKLAPLWPPEPPLATVELEIAWLDAQTLPDWLGERLPTV